MRNPSVNRGLDDPSMDCIDHALGRPVDPLKETKRNNFYTKKNGPDAISFRSSGYWDERPGWDHENSYFSVNDKGRRALAAYLKENGNTFRHYEVEVRDGIESTFHMDVVAETPSRARYLAWVDLNDCWEITFGDFVKEHLVGTRLAR